MTWAHWLASVSATISVAALLGALKLWRSHGLVEQTLYGRRGAPGLVDVVEGLKAEMKDRDHATRGKMQEAVSELEGRIRELERLFPRKVPRE